jgi:hypothetical protein
MPTDYKNTTLWKAAFAGLNLSDAQSEMRDRLRTALSQFETHVSDLLSKIPDSCKGLTVHDIRHVHQLWHVASTICGPTYPLNPLEGFVLGGAFLIHDAGLTAAAYPGGVDGLRRTSLYRDMLAIELKRGQDNLEITDALIDNPPPHLEDRVLFALLRQVHPDRALHLIDEAYVEPLTKHNWTIVPIDLLLDVGLTIGRVAASHHWDIGRVANEFGDPLPPPAAFPSWSIDTVKLSCILRCADACAIDERRAPLMAHVLEQPQGVSREHWIFQAFLNPAHLPSGQEGLVFRSKRPMKREEMNAWWQAYDAINVADRELRDCDRLLKYRAGQRDHAREIPLAAKRVEGAGDTAGLAKLVMVDGWQPIDTAVRVGDPLALIERFGGKHLYGNDHTAPVRELVQNAADAVRARRCQNGYGPKAPDDAGEIHISIKKIESGDWVLRVSDDGIGMPDDVLAGAFLDFGKSLWRSDKIASLYPGLVSNQKFRPTGQFGIGFYASFIIGQDVKVLSKPSNGGDDRRKVLHFKSGVRKRAELRAYEEALDGAWPYGQSTIVEIRFRGDEWVTNFAALSVNGALDRPLFSSESQYWDFFAKTLEQLVFCLDVHVIFSTDFFREQSINRTNIFESPPSEFAKEFNRVFAFSDTYKFPDELIPLIDYIDDYGVKSKSR